MARIKNSSHFYLVMFTYFAILLIVIYAKDKPKIPISLYFIDIFIS